MSLSFTLVRTVKYDDDGEEFTHEIFSANITHNLGKMAKEAGIYKALWRPEENDFVYARDIQYVLHRGLEELKSHPEKYKMFDSHNGWGVYDHFVTFVEKVLDACIKYPSSKIEVSR